MKRRSEGWRNWREGGRYGQEEGGGRGEGSFFLITEVWKGMVSDCYFGKLVSHKPLPLRVVCAGFLTRLLVLALQIRGMHTLIRNMETKKHDFVFYADRLIRLVR